MNLRAGSGAALLLPWLVLLLLTLLLRPLLPVDETRYLGVAWEMWQRGDFLVPFLNGEPYSHKPPLYFWLIHAGWWLFGVNEWWPRSVAALVSLASLLAVSRLAGLLWPKDHVTRGMVPWVLFGCVFWTAFYPWVQIDMLLVLFTLVGMIGIVQAALGRPSGWLLTGLGIGLGVLSKGPVILLHVLPVALLAPVWIDRRAGQSWLAWYGGVAVSVITGAAIALAWALPAAEVGGEAYRQAILWGQTADRMVNAFAHAHPWWWYLPWLPLLAAPWVLLPWLWRYLFIRPQDAGVRFCMSWLLATLLLVSLISGKQAKYLLPLLPVLALLITHALMHMQHTVVSQRPWLLAAVLLICGVSLAVLPGGADTATWLTGISPLWGVLLSVLAITLLLLRNVPVTRYVRLITLLSVVVIAMVQLAVFAPARPAYDLQEASRIIARAQADDRPVANLGKYHGQFHFYGRLQQPLASLTRAAAREWGRDNPQGYLVVYYAGEAPSHAEAVYAQLYRGGSLVIREGRTVSADAEVLP
ncbi:MAG: glycosyltransferase family 39 protein [Pseudomonadota bacterium]